MVNGFIFTDKARKEYLCCNKCMSELPGEIKSPNIWSSIQRVSEEGADVSDLKVLCVDDEFNVLFSLRRLLNGEPYALLTTDNPLQALQYAEKVDVNLVIADQRMPKMTGTELIEPIRKRHPNTIFIILTAYPDDPGITNNIGKINRLIRKPWDGFELRKTIIELLQEQGRN